MAHGDVRQGKWRVNWRMEWVASTLHTTSEHGVSSINTADAHNSAASSRLNCRPPADLNGLVRFVERRNLVSARVPSHFNWSIILYWSLGDCISVSSLKGLFDAWAVWPLKMRPIGHTKMSVQNYQSRPAFLNRPAAARYRALASVIPGRERFSWNW